MAELSTLTMHFQPAVELGCSSTPTAVRGAKLGTLSVGVGTQKEVGMEFAGSVVVRYL